MACPEFSWSSRTAPSTTCRPASPGPCSRSCRPCGRRMPRRPSRSSPAVAVVMEAVARRLAGGKASSSSWPLLVPLVSHPRAGRIAAEVTCARRNTSMTAHHTAHAGCRPRSTGSEDHRAGAEPGVVFAPHVETAAGMFAPGHLRAPALAAVHAVGGVLVSTTASHRCPVGRHAAKPTSTCSSPGTSEGLERHPATDYVLLSEHGRATVGPRPRKNAPLKAWLRIADARLCREPHPITPPCRPTRSWPTLPSPGRPWHAGWTRLGRRKLGELAGRCRRADPIAALPSVAAPGMPRLRRRRPRRRPSPPVGAAFQAGPASNARRRATQMRRTDSWSPSDSDSSGSTSSIDVSGTARRLEHALDRATTGG